MKQGVVEKRKKQRARPVPNHWPGHTGHGRAGLRMQADTDDADTIFPLDMSNKLKDLDEQKRPAAQLQIHTLIYNLKYGQ